MSQESDEYQLSTSAAEYLEKAVGDLRKQLVREAKHASKGEPVAAVHIEHAWFRLGWFSREVEDAQSIITRTLRESRAVEWVAYAMALTLFSELRHLRNDLTEVRDDVKRLGRRKRLSLGRWLCRLDRTLFCPPHTFESVLTLVLIPLGTFLTEGSDRPPPSAADSDLRQEPIPK